MVPCKRSCDNFVARLWIMKSQCLLVKKLNLMLKILKSRSNVKVKATRSKLWHGVICLMRRDTHVNYESSTFLALKLWTRLKLLKSRWQLYVRRSTMMVPFEMLCYKPTRNAHGKYKIHICHGSHWVYMKNTSIGAVRDSKNSTWSLVGRNSEKDEERRRRRNGGNKRVGEK